MRLQSLVGKLYTANQKTQTHALRVTQTPQPTMPSKFSLRNPFKRNKEPQPPPYWSLSYLLVKSKFECELGYGRNPYSHLILPTISASSVPQWLWTNAQCRAWLFAILTTSLGNSKSDALIKAENVKSFGPYSWSMDDVQWRRYLGKEDVQSVFNLLVSVSNEQRTVPNRFTFEHLETEGKLRRKKQ
jgi:hypothetical protein